MAWREDRIAWYLEEMARMHQGIELMKADIPATGTEQSCGGPLDSHVPELIEQYERTIETLARAIGTLEGEASCPRAAPRRELLANMIGAKGHFLSFADHWLPSRI
jgi:hypothetical protein